MLTPLFAYENVRVSLFWPLKLCTCEPQTSCDLTVCCVCFSRWTSPPCHTECSLTSSCRVLPCVLRFCISRPLCLEFLFSLLPHRSVICLSHSAVAEADVILFGRVLICWLLPILARLFADGVLLYLLMSVCLTGL